MALYKALTTILFGVDRIEVDGEIELTEKEAKPLLSSGAVEKVESKKPEAPEGEAKLQAIKDAILKLDATVTEHWLKDGRPDTKAIVALTEWSVTAAERDAAWEQVKPAA